MEPMKILIGYDGSQCSESALADLKYAGFPRNVEARVISERRSGFPLRPASAEL